MSYSRAAFIKEKNKSLSKKKFSEEIYLIAEAKYSHKFVERDPIVERDPLLIRFDNKYHEPYLVGIFDCTPLELYAAEKFTLDKRGLN